MKNLDVNAFMQAGRAFRDRLETIKAADVSFAWYPYDSMSNMGRLEHLLPASLVRDLLSGGQRVLDVGAADGDLGYFFDSQGCDVDFLDNAATNANDCKGIVALAKALGSNAQLIENDLDRIGDPLHGQYDLAIALGLLYHLRNPMGFLIMLAEHAQRMVLSTRVANHLPDGTDVSGQSMAYLLRCRESNNDPTNYWTMSPLGLEVMLKRCGWNVLAKEMTGAERSNPVDQKADQRMFVYCERVENWRDLGKHHDF